jgi:hypothetical protein
MRKLRTLALLAYTLLALLVLHPLIFNNGTHAAGYDYFHFHWNFWWIRHALTTPDLSVYESNFVMFPYTNNMAYATLAVFWYPLWAVLEPITGTLTAMTVIIIAGAVLQGYVFFAFLRHEGASPGLAFLGGAVLQVTPVIRYFYYNTHLNLIGWFWLPVHLYLWQRTVKAVEGGDRRVFGWMALQALGLWLMVLTGLQLVLLLAMLLVPYGLWTLWHTSRRVPAVLAAFVAPAAALILLWFAGPLPYLFNFQGTLVPGEIDGRPGIPLTGFLWTHDAWWHWDVPTVGGFVALAVLVSVIFGRGKRERWLWFGLMVPPLLIALGPSLPFYRWFFDLTDGNFRMPWRMAPVYVIAGMMFVAKSWPVAPNGGRQEGASRRAPTLVAAFMVMAVSLRLYQPGPVVPVVQHYDFYEAMGEEPYEYVIVQAPTGAGSGEVLIGNDTAIAFQYYALDHGQRVINGFIARAPLEHFWYLRTDDPLLSWLGQRRDLDPDQVRAQLQRIIPEWPLGYIVLHKDTIWQNPEAVREITGYFNSQRDLLCPVYLEGDAIAYRTSWHPDGCPPLIPPEIEPGVYQIDIGAFGDERYTGWGWYWSEDIAGISARWTGDRQPHANLYFDLPPGEYTATLTVQAHLRERPVAVLVNDEPVAEFEISSAGLADYTFTLTVDDPTVRLTLDYGEGEAAGDRTLGILVDRLTFGNLSR